MLAALVGTPVALNSGPSKQRRSLPVREREMVHMATSSSRMMNAYGCTCNKMGIITQIFWVYFAGFRDACCVHRAYFFCRRSQKVFLRTVQCFLLNGFIFLGIYFFIEKLVTPMVHRILAFPFGEKQHIGSPVIETYLLYLCQMGHPVREMMETRQFFIQYWDLVAQPLREGLQHMFDTGSMPQSMSSGIISLIPKGGDAFTLISARLMFDTGSMPQSMSSGIISLIPKGGDAFTLRQWRPITLISARLRPFLPDLIHLSQTGFVQDRSILDNVATFSVAMEWARQMEQPTSIMLLDFEKAYDRVDWAFLEGTLSRMGFPLPWIWGIFALYRSATAAVTIGGHVGRRCSLSQLGLLVLPLYGLSYVASCIWYNEIARNAFTVLEGNTYDDNKANPQQMQTSQRKGNESASGLDGMLFSAGEQTYSVLMLLIFYFEVRAATAVPYLGKFLMFPLRSWLYAYYFFDYAWGYAKWSLEKRLMFFETNWAFFAGFGSPCVLATLPLTGLVQDGVLAFLFPLFVLVAFGSHPEKLVAAYNVPQSQMPRIPIFYLTSVLMNKLFLTSKMAYELFGRVTHIKQES
ncbi:hypothetical protein L7F22_066630 [Adiantum nelumboides]|nr:hypothetical protein [Adiantum nelumboides]